ncbi:hypothetical protein IM043_gp264 [Bacillus phage SPG24]|nr:hypothetical protein IM043_gp264 [Bacillus phage SPG24]
MGPIGSLFYLLCTLQLLYNPVTCV